MSFIMISAGTTSAARMRTVSLRSVVVGATCLSVGLLAAGAGLGHWLASAGVTGASTAIAGSAAAAPAPNSALPFALEQLGALSGRLFKLESQAGQLSERIGVTLKGLTPKIDKTPAKPGSGGPLLPPRALSGTSNDSPALEALGDLGEIEARLGQIEQQIGLVADAASLQNLAQLRLPTRAPVPGAQLGSPFGNREDPFSGRSAFHSGLDFAAVQGTQIHAAAGGKVAYAGQRSDYGWVVEIDHGNGLTTRYAHASKLMVKAGDLVMPGDVIAAVGSTGRSTGAHLHFEVLRGGEAVDPRRYLAGL